MLLVKEFNACVPYTGVLSSQRLDESMLAVLVSKLPAFDATKKKLAVESYSEAVEVVEV